MPAMKANLESLNVGDMFLTKYEVRGLIGRGGQAVVYHSYDTFIDRDVAIKIMVDAFDSKREHSRRAQMEARVLCRLQHSNIVHVYDAGTAENGAIYIIMELLKGRTLREVLRDHRKLTVYEALSIGAQIADGVEVAHRQQVIHRDLKPENIFVVDGNLVKVLDFGIAKFLTLTGITTQRDTLQGTMWYISPEHVQGFGVTARSDVYALGSILFEAIYGTPPCLVGLQEISTQSVAWSQISRVPPQLDEIMPEVPPHVGRLIQRMLVKEPKERPGSMAEVAEELRAACSRIEAEAKHSPVALRELWHDTPTDLESEAPAPTDLDVVAKNESEARKVMQPTIEVRQPGPRPAAPSDADIRGTPAPRESGVIVPTARPPNLQPPKVVAPVADTTESVIDTRGAQTVRDTGVVPSEPVVASSVAVDSELPAKLPLLSNRRVLITAAVVVGTGIGLALGLSGHLSSRAGKDEVTPSAASTAGLEQPRLSSSRPSDSLAVSATPVPSVVTHSTPPTETGSASATQNRTIHAPPPRTATPAIPSAVRKRPSSEGPQPRYKVDDLE